MAPALLNRVRDTDQTASDRLLEEIAGNRAMHMTDNTSVSVINMIERVNDALANVPDYRRPKAKIDFITLVWGLGTFLELKLDSSVEQDRYAEYLFQHDDLPIEKDLQQDFLRHGCRTPDPGRGQGVAGGRADIRYDSGRHRLTIEVKRELREASFDNLIASYGEQTLMYQVTNLKLGIMLALDLSFHNVTVAHTKRASADLLRDGTERGVLIVKVPGRRGTPSAATAAAKKTSGKRRRTRRSG